MADKAKKIKEIFGSITPKIFLSSFIPIAFVGLITCFSFVHITDGIIMENVKSEASGALSISESRVMDIFNDSLSNLNMVASVAKNSGSKRDIDLIQKNAVGKESLVEAFYYVTTEPLDNGGYLLMSDDWKAPSSFSQFERPWYKNAIALNGKFAFDRYLNTRINKQCIAVSRAVIDEKNGKILGVCGFDIGLDTLKKVVEFRSLSENSTLCIIDENGRYLAAKDESLVLLKNYLEVSNLAKSGVELENFLDGKQKTLIIGDRFYGVQKLGFMPWYIVTEGPVSDFKSDFGKKVIVVIFVTIIICLLCDAFILYVMQLTRRREKELGAKLFGETQNLVVATKETAATSQDQSAAVKEIVATMEDSNALSENISAKIKDVSKIAHTTSADVLSGVDTLAQNVQKLNEIFDANQQTISGIKALGNKIENIWDIVTLINSVADQAKIIAFNAELEASSAGEAGKNFHIVATEIRRLADGIIDGTKEIKERITEIQQSSDSLILMSESGTEKINEGVAKATELEQKFDSIKSSAEVTANSSEDITSIIQQQTIASEQILITLKQIAAGVENFSQATENISGSAENVRVIAEQLNE